MDNPKMPDYTAEIEAARKAQKPAPDQPGSVFPVVVGVGVRLLGVAKTRDEAEKLAAKNTPAGFSAKPQVFSAVPA